MSQQTRIATDIDYEASGKQQGVLEVPHSRNDSAWGAVLVPIVVIRNGTGPTVLLTGGNHGDEYEGQVALAKLARELRPEDVRGRVIILPVLNPPAANAGTRVSPVDGGNLNRSFPGRYDGSVTSMIAHYVDSILLPMADVVVDLHSGGTSLEFLPSVVMHVLPDAAQMKRTFGALRAFGAPAGLVLEELDAEGMLDTAAERRGAVFLSTELGGGARVGIDALRVAERGVRNVLAHFEVIDGGIEQPPEATRILDVRDRAQFLKAPADALFEPLVEVGQAVEPQQPIARLVFPHEPWRETFTLEAETAGIVWGRRAVAPVRRGDVITVVARDLDPASVPGLA